MYFTNINTLSELKKSYRKLAFANHPDRGGDEAKMKEINNEFEARYEQLKDIPENTQTGYEQDGFGYSASQYTSYVYNEYKGSRYDPKLRQGDLSKIFREWLKETYPSLRFSVKQGNGSWTKSFKINWIQSDFCPFTKGNENLTGKSINHYHIEGDDELNDRGKDVWINVISHIESYNYDNSDIMTDYFDVNFYSYYGMGDSTHKFVWKPLEIKPKGAIFKRRLGPTERAIKEAMGGNHFAPYTSYSSKNTIIVLCKGERNNPLWYSQPTLIRDRISKLDKAGILSHCKNELIIFDGYKDGIEAALKAEKEAEDKRE